MSRKLALAVVTAFAFVVTASGAAEAQSKCSGGKIKTAGKKASSKLDCLSKGISKGLAPDSTCLAKAEVKFSSAYAKAEAKTYTDAGCLTTGDAAAIESKVDTLYSDINALVADTPPGGPNACDSMKVKAAGKKTAAKLTCHSKAVTKGISPVDSTCIAKAEVKFSSAAAKAETKVPPACTATGDAGTYESTIDAAVNDIVTELTPTTSTTTTSTTSSTTTTCPAPTPPSIKGALSPPTIGRFNYNLTLGLPGANAACNTNFACTHACTYAELQAAQAAGELDGLMDTANTPVTSFWAIDPAADPLLAQCHDDVAFPCPGGVCPPGHTWEYGTAHTPSRGQKVALDNLTGALGPLQTMLQCNFSGNSWVGCCE